MKKSFEKSVEFIVIMESLLVIFNILYYYWIKTILVGFYLILYFISLFMTIALLITLLYISWKYRLKKRKEQAEGRTS
ncbi:MAG: hypothetical protein ACTSU4_10470 [Promethearchaeota archaeon]